MVRGVQVGTEEGIGPPPPDYRAFAAHRWRDHRSPIQKGTRLPNLFSRPWDLCVPRVPRARGTAIPAPGVCAAGAGASAFVPPLTAWPSGGPPSAHPGGGRSARPLCVLGSDPAAGR